MASKTTSPSWQQTLSNVQQASAKSASSGGQTVFPSGSIYNIPGGMTTLSGGISLGGGISSGPNQNMTPVPPRTISPAQLQSVSTSPTLSPTMSTYGLTSLGSAPVGTSLKPITLPQIQSPVTISAGGLKTSNQAVGLPVAPAPTNVGSLATANNVGLMNTLSPAYTYDKTTNQYVQNPVQTTQLTEEQQLEKERKDLAQQVLGILPKREDVLTSPEVLAQQAEVQRQRQLVNDATSQLNMVMAKQNQDLLQLREIGSKEGVTEAVYGGQQATINREAAIKALPLQALVASAQGNLQLAQDYLGQITSMKKEASDNAYNYQVAKFDAVKDYVTGEQKIRLEQLREKQRRAYDERNKNIDLQKTWALQASQSGQGSLIPQIMDQDPSSPNFMSNLGRITANIIDRNAILDTQLKRTQIDNAILQGQKLKSEIEMNKPVTGEYASVINGAAGLVANTKKQQVKDNIATALSSGNFTNAYAEIANAVSDGLTGTPKTKFDDARTDIGVMTGMRNAIQNYANSGGDMNILAGTEEEIKRKLGIDSGKASALATQLWREFQTYRSNMTGAAFTPTESRDYASVNPTLGKNLNLNLNVIDGALAQLNNRVTSTVNARIPDAEKIYNLATGGTKTVMMSPDGTQQVNISELTPAQIEEAKNAGWK